MPSSLHRDVSNTSTDQATPYNPNFALKFLHLPHNHNSTFNDDDEADNNDDGLPNQQMFPHAVNGEPSNSEPVNVFTWRERERGREERERFFTGGNSKS